MPLPSCELVRHHGGHAARRLRNLAERNELGCLATLHAADLAPHLEVPGVHREHSLNHPFPDSYSRIGYRIAFRRCEKWYVLVVPAHLI